MAGDGVDALAGIRPETEGGDRHDAAELRAAAVVNEMAAQPGSEGGLVKIDQLLLRFDLERHFPKRRSEPKERLRVKYYARLTSFGVKAFADESGEPRSRCMCTLSDLLAPPHMKIAPDDDDLFRFRSIWTV